MSDAMELCVGAEVVAPNRKGDWRFLYASVLQSFVHLVDCQKKPETSEVCEETGRSFWRWDWADAN